MDFQTMIIIFALCFTAISFFELIKLGIEYYTDRTDPDPEQTATLYELNVLFVTGYDRTCYLNDLETATELLAYYNLDPQVQSTLLYHNGQDITFAREIDNAKSKL